MYVLKKGTPIWFDNELIGQWDEHLEVQYYKFDYRWLKLPPKLQVKAEDLSADIPINEIRFQVCFTVEKGMHLTVDTLNGLRYIKHFLPEDSILSKLPR